MGRKNMYDLVPEVLIALHSVLLLQVGCQDYGPFVGPQEEEALSFRGTPKSDPKTCNP